MEKRSGLHMLSCGEDEKLLMAHLLDLADACRNRSIPACSRFLTEQEQALAVCLMHRTGEEMLLWGGYEDAERKVALFLPEYLTKENLSFSLCELKLLRCEQDKYHSPLTHRDYLGALMALGVERETIGDILIDGYSADLIVTESAAALIADSLTSVGRCRVECREVSEDQIHIPVRQYETFSDTVASLRLDCVIAAGFRLSREEASRAIRGGRVQVNGRAVEKNDAEVKEGSKLSLRGAGKVILAEVNGLSKKGRVRVIFHRPR